MCRHTACKPEYQIRLEGNTLTKELRELLENSIQTLNLDQNWIIPTHNLFTDQYNFVNETLELLRRGVEPSSIAHPLLLTPVNLPRRVVICGYPRSGNVLTLMYCSAMLTSGRSSNDCAANHLCLNFDHTLLDLLSEVKIALGCNYIYQNNEGYGLNQKRFIFAKGNLRHELVFPVMDYYKESVSQTHTNVQIMMDQASAKCPMSILALIRDPLCTLLSNAEFIPPPAMDTGAFRFSSRENAAHTRLSSRDWLECALEDMKSYYSGFTKYWNSLEKTYFEDHTFDPRQYVANLNRVCNTHHDSQQLDFFVNYFYRKPLTPDWTEHFNPDTRSKTSLYLSKGLLEMLENAGLLAIGESFGYDYSTIALNNGDFPWKLKAVPIPNSFEVQNLELDEAQSMLSPDNQIIWNILHQSLKKFYQYQGIGIQQNIDFPVPKIR